MTDSLPFEKYFSAASQTPLNFSVLVKGTHLQKTCFVQEGQPFSNMLTHQNKTSKSRIFFFYVLHWFIFNLDFYLYLCKWQLVGWAVENAVKCHSWPSGYLQPLWAWSQGLGKVNMHLSCSLSKRQCRQQGWKKILATVAGSQSLQLIVD